MKERGIKIYLTNKQRNMIFFYTLANDQNNGSIDLRGKEITVRICIREVKNIKRDIVRAIKPLKQDSVL